MSDFYTRKKANELLAQHKQATDAMKSMAHQLGATGARAVSLWSEVAALLPDEATAAGEAFVADAQTSWATAKADLAKALDALAAGMGVTRASLLSDLGDVPATEWS